MRESDTSFGSIGLASKMESRPTILHMKKLGSREYDVSVTYCCVTNHPITEPLKPQNYFIAPNSVGQDFGQSSAVLSQDCPLWCQPGWPDTLGALRLAAGSRLSGVAQTLHGGSGSENTRPQPRTRRASLLSPSIAQSQSQCQHRFRRKGIDTTS